MKPLQEESVNDIKEAMDHLSLAATREVSGLNFDVSIALLKTAADLYNLAENGREYDREMADMRSPQPPRAQVEPCTRTSTSANRGGGPSCA